MTELQKFWKFKYLWNHMSRLYTKCREENTIKNHQQYFASLEATDIETRSFFFTGCHVALCLLSKIQAGVSVPTIEASSFAVTFFYSQIVLNIDLCKNYMAEKILEVTKRILFS